jgi:hypothetical protein
MNRIAVTGTGSLIGMKLTRDVNENEILRMNDFKN